jgi:hypothetical protein
MLSTHRNTICTETPLIVDVKEETEFMSRPRGSTRNFFPNRGNQEIGFEVLVAVTILNVTQCHHEHAKESARSKQRALYFFLIACFTYSLTLKLEAVLSFEISMNLQATLRYHIPEDTSTLLSQKICLHT